MVHPATRLTRYIYDELSFLYYPTPCGSVVDVNSLDHNASKTRNWYRLLPVFLGIILLVQAGSAYVYHFQLDQSVSPQEIQLGDSVTMKFHVYDTENGVGFASAPVTISIYRTIPAGQVRIDLVTANASGWATYTYTPQEAARFAFNSYSSVNYSTYPGFPPVGMQSSVGDPPGSYFNVTAKPLIPVFTLKPVDPIVFVTTTTTTAPPVTTTPDSTADNTGNTGNAGHTGHAGNPGTADHLRRPGIAERHDPAGHHAHPRGHGGRERRVQFRCDLHAGCR